MSVALVVLVMAALLVAVSFSEPIAARVRLPASVLLAVFGVVIGAAASFLQTGALGPGAEHAAEMIADLPLNSDAFLFVFLPLLLFQSAMNTEFRQIVDDASTIFILAIVAVVISTLVIGFALAPVAGVPLAACLLLGAIVATTDPIAVIGIFREAGAPARLVRLVEGESLLNDAAAITLFALFLDLIVTGQALGAGETALKAIVMPLGGAALGVVAGRVAASLIGALRDNALAPTSVSLGLPYLCFVVAEHGFHVSGVMAVVAAGITLAAVGPAKAPPEVWRHLKGVWEQLDWWAASMIFVLASILAPRLLIDATQHDLLLLAVLVVAAFAARGAIVFGLMPALTAVNLAPRISVPFRWVILWGGLRGATTLVLALAVTEREAVPPEIRSFVAVLATGYVLFTLLVQGTTLRSLVRTTGLDRLSPVDQALRGDVFAAARARVAEMVATAAAAHGLTAPPVDLEAAARPKSVASVDPEQRAAVALVTLARAEREMIMERVRERSVSLALVDRLLGDVRRLSDRSRAAGAEGYRQAYLHSLEFSWAEHAAQKVARATGWSKWLTHALADRFETLLVTSVALRRLSHIVDEAILPVLGAEPAAAAAAALAQRREAVDRALAALRLQYPDYARALERRLLGNAALQLEESEYDRIYEDGLIGPELHRDLLIEVGHRRSAADARPKLDLGLDPRTLLARLPLLSGLSLEALDRLTRLVEPVFARPGERLITAGDVGREAFFLSSGAVEVTSPSGEIVRLGRGDIFGEIALLTDRPRTADVDAMAYCSLLRLRRRAFEAFLSENPEAAVTIEATAAQRLRANEED